MQPTSEIHKIAFLGAVLPRKCGIAMFTSDVLAPSAVAAEHPQSQCFVVPVSDLLGGYEYPDGVRFEIAEQDLSSYQRAAVFLNISNASLVCVQHEFGITRVSSCPLPLCPGRGLRAARPAPARSGSGSGTPAPSVSVWSALLSVRRSWRVGTARPQGRLPLPILSARGSLPKFRRRAPASFNPGMQLSRERSGSGPLPASFRLRTRPIITRQLLKRC